MTPQFKDFPHISLPPTFFVQSLAHKYFQAPRCSPIRKEHLRLLLSQPQIVEQYNLVILKYLISNLLTFKEYEDSIGLKF